MAGAVESTGRVVAVTTFDKLDKFETVAVARELSGFVWAAMWVAATKQN